MEIDVPDDCSAIVFLADDTTELHLPKQTSGERALPQTVKVLMCMHMLNTDKLANRVYNDLYKKAKIRGTH